MISYSMAVVIVIVIIVAIVVVIPVVIRTISHKCKRIRRMLAKTCTEKATI